MGKKNTRKTLSIKKSPFDSALGPSLTMDGTAHIEISSMGNIHYSREIIESTEAASDLDKLRASKRDKGKFLNIGKQMLNKLCGGKDALGAHDNAFRVKFLIKVGIILSEIETAFKDSHKYINWLKNNFSHERLRYFQHARQLARMGDTALKYASLGKNRLLEFERARKEFSKESGADKTLDDLSKEHPFLDTAEDNNGELFKRHVDAIISYYRVMEAGIDSIKFEQAYYAASLEKKAIEVKRIKQLKKNLDNAKDKGKFLDDFFKNKMVSPVPRESATGSRKSLNKILADFVLYCDTSDINSQDWIRMQKNILSEEIFLEAYNYMVKMKDNLEIMAPYKRRGNK